MELMILRCKDCDSLAVAIDDIRITPSTCSDWRVEQKWNVDASDFPGKSSPMLAELVMPWEAYFALCAIVRHFCSVDWRIKHGCKSGVCQLRKLCAALLAWTKEAPEEEKKNWDGWLLDCYEEQE